MIRHLFTTLAVVAVAVGGAWLAVAWLVSAATVPTGVTP